MPSLHATEPIPMPGRLPDPSFRAILGEFAWRRLPHAVRQRFAWKPAPGSAIVYGGSMREVRATRIGRLAAQLCRLVGTPIAPYRGTDVPVTVRLSLDGDANGIVWERIYHFPGHVPVRCASVKKVVDGGLVEVVGRSIGMRLELGERQGELHFRSAGYFWQARRRRVALPDWLAPGEMHVVHADVGAGRFRFRLSLTHRLFGEILYQDGIFAAEGS
jgi:Domain of unknown function (DUF4166)